MDNPALTEEDFYWHIRPSMTASLYDQVIARGFRSRENCTYLDIPTGTGKCRTISMMAKDMQSKKQRVWILVPDSFLVDQMAEALKEEGVSHGILDPKDLSKYRVMLGSTVIVKKYYDELVAKLREPDLIIQDEYPACRLDFPCKTVRVI